MGMSVYIEAAHFPKDTEAIRSLFSGYAESLGIDLAFQEFDKELDSLPGKYAESQGGALLIARVRKPNEDSDRTAFAPLSTSHSTKLAPPFPAVGCVALRSNSDNWCEMKRLYVVPEARGLRLGDQLVAAIIEKAKLLGYRGIRLDTLPTMTAAQKLYRRYGLVKIESYYDTPIENTVFMGCDFNSVLPEPQARA
ncbi:hypothetical protein N7495_007371 [Penicillium taxi]|uniref:uncharacterized protein n=1 Tax=Penicillium taxi TaxID=168475 RepID=UPI00254519BF|nr:uncharacterized protein N7495_007371 [Penicillium taxi]KAJ5895680.1 hypothetical protein N7495_007371 [Penicillium taxi]